MMMDNDEKMLPQFCRLLWHSVRKPGGLILQPQAALGVDPETPEKIRLVETAATFSQPKISLDIFGYW